MLRAPAIASHLSTRVSALLLVTLALGMMSCGPSYRLSPPDEFKRFTQDSGLKYITADGIRLKAREVENYPQASLSFWTDALRRHMLARGYAFKDKTCFETESHLPGCTLDFLTPRGAEDWVHSVTIFVAGERLILLEAVGPYGRFAPLQDKLRASFKTFSLIE